MKKNERDYKIEKKSIKKKRKLWRFDLNLEIKTNKLDYFIWIIKGILLLRTNLNLVLN